MKRIVAWAAVLCLTAGTGALQAQPGELAEGTRFGFDFRPEGKLLLGDYRNNRTELERLRTLTRTHQDELRNGEAHYVVVSYIRPGESSNDRAINNASVQGSVVRAYMKVWYGLSNACFTFYIDNTQQASNRVEVFYVGTPIAAEANRAICYTESTGDALKVSRAVSKYDPVPFIGSYVTYWDAENRRRREEQELMARRQREEQELMAQREAAARRLAGARTADSLRRVEAERQQRIREEAARQMREEQELIAARQREEEARRLAEEKAAAEAAAAAAEAARLAAQNTAQNTARSATESAETPFFVTDIPGLTVDGQRTPVKMAKPSRQERVKVQKVKIPKEPKYREYNYHWAFETNLLYWLAATPNLGVKYHFADRWAVEVSGGYAWWSWKNGDRRFYVWGVKPQLHYWLRNDGSYHGHCIGVYGHWGQYDIKLGRRGRQGDYYGGGFSYNYLFPLSDAFDMGLNLDLGYVHSPMDKYASEYDAYFVRTEKQTKNYFGPTGIGVTVVWKLGYKWQKKRGVSVGNY